MKLLVSATATTYNIITNVLFWKRSDIKYNTRIFIVMGSYDQKQNHSTTYGLWIYLLITSEVVYKVQCKVSVLYHSVKFPLQKYHYILYCYHYAISDIFLLFLRLIFIYEFFGWQLARLSWKILYNTVIRTMPDTYRIEYYNDEEYFHQHKKLIAIDDWKNVKNWDGKAQHSTLYCRKKLSLRM